MTLPFDSVVGNHAVGTEYRQPRADAAVRPYAEDLVRYEASTKTDQLHIRPIEDYVINPNNLAADQQIHIPNCTGYTFLAYAVQTRSSVQRNAFGDIK